MGRVKKIIIFGTGKTSESLLPILDKSCEIIAYADNDNLKWGMYINGKEIINPKYIPDYYYDFIVIASQYNREIYNQLLEIGIERKKIFQLYKYLDIRTNYINEKLMSLKYQNYECVATGISYTASGFVEEKCKVKTIKCAFASQDLFYDFKFIDYIIQNNNINSMKYCIIGLGYYSFQYDMSSSSTKDKVILYYNAFKTYHNYKEKLDFDDYVENDKIGNDILNLESNPYNSFDKMLIEFNNKDLCCKINLGKKQANIDCNKNYPETVKENKQILKDYLKLLKDNNIKPIVVVFPASKYYTKYFSKRIEDEFHSIINEVRKEYDFQYIDYFRSELFDDEDFQDVSHLNSKGAEKFTNILNDIIEW